MYWLKQKNGTQIKSRDMLNKTHDLELKIKSNSPIDKNILLKNLIVDICNQANS